jgi:hypothetical protein
MAAAGVVEQLFEARQFVLASEKHGRIISRALPYPVLFGPDRREIARQT